MSRSSPEPLALLHRRLLQAEEEAEALIRDVGALGAPRGRTVMGPAPASPLEEHRAPGREVMELRDRLQRACRERDSARREVGRLGERLQEAAAATKDVALAADELKIVKIEMSQKLTKRTVLTETFPSRAMKEQMRRQLEDEAERRRALRTRLVQQLQNQDVLLAAARRSVHTELQGALREKVNLQSALEKLTDEHSQLLQSSSAALQTANTQREQLERTIERLRGEPLLERTIERLRGEPLRKDLQGSRTQVSELEADGQTPETLQASRDELQLHRQSRQQEPEDSARLQARREIGKHRSEVEKLQRLLTSTHSKSSRALESLQKASVAARVDNKRLAQSLERHRAAATIRDEELREARTEIVRLFEELGVAKQRRQEPASVKKSKANQELRQKSRDSQDNEKVQEAELERWTSTIQRWEGLSSA